MLPSEIKTRVTGIAVKHDHDYATLITITNSC